jgi:hypothetical protein
MDTEAGGPAQHSGAVTVPAGMLTSTILYVYVPYIYMCQLSARVRCLYSSC